MDINLYNTIPGEIKQIENFKSFTRELKLFFYWSTHFVHYRLFNYVELV
jgi:hypothetical protein